jgi:glycosyltransferase involved in cell wall biosynthesis
MPRTMIFSIIVPVYNIEKYLMQCVDSILCSTINDMEVILVNDGSSDESYQICDNYEKRDNRITVIHQENGGLSAARNSGIKIAKGEYLLFVDGDDWIDASVLVQLETMIKKSPNPLDVVFLEIVKSFPNGTQQPMGDGYNVELINGKDKKTVMNHLANLSKYPGSACAKCIRRELIISNNLLFENGLLSEDIDWTVLLYRLAQTFGYIPQPYYFYRQVRPGSITQGSNPKRLGDLLYIVEKHANADTTNDYQTQVNAFMAFEYMICIYLYSTLPAAERKPYKGRLKKLKWLLKYGRSGKIKLVRWVSTFLGISITSKMLSVFKRRAKTT